MVQRSHRVAAASDGNERAFLGKRRRRAGKRDRRRVEGLRFERAHRPVPHKRAAGLEHVGKGLHRLLELEQSEWVGIIHTSEYYTAVKGWDGKQWYDEATGNTVDRPTGGWFIELSKLKDVQQ